MLLCTMFSFWTWSRILTDLQVKTLLSVLHVGLLVFHIFPSLFVSDLVLGAFFTIILQVPTSHALMVHRAHVRVPHKQSSLFINCIFFSK